MGLNEFDIYFAKSCNEIELKTGGNFGARARIWTSSASILKDSCILANAVYGLQEAFCQRLSRQHFEEHLALLQVRA